MIDAASELGLSEILEEPATRDEGEIAHIQPELRAASAINPFSEHIGTARCSGITTALAMPARGWIRGQSAVIDLAGWTFPDMRRSDDFALHVAIPVLPADLTQEEREKRTTKHEEQMRELDDFLIEARHYADVMDLPDSKTAHHERDLRLEAMRPYVRVERPVVFYAQSYKHILESIDFADKHRLRCVICGGREAWKCADLLAEKKIPVIIAKVTSYPGGKYEPFDSVYACAAVLDSAGVQYAFASGSASDSFNLPIDVGLAVANGLAPDRAMYAMTLGAAKILGIDDQVGSLEPGKIANVFISSDLPIEVTSGVTAVFIRGKPIALTSIHTENLEKFSRRPEPKLPPPAELVGPPSLSRRPD
jgi:imidazolonepropionase-like amidohydrolase